MAPPTRLPNVYVCGISAFHEGYNTYIRTNQNVFQVDRSFSKAMNGAASTFIVSSLLVAVFHYCSVRTRRKTITKTHVCFCVFRQSAPIYRLVGSRPDAYFASGYRHVYPRRLVIQRFNIAPCWSYMASIPAASWSFSVYRSLMILDRHA